MRSECSVFAEYAICIDNSTETTEYCSAFYRLYKNKEGYWQHDGCQDWYSYEIDFSDKNWKEKLKEAAEKAYEELWECCKGDCRYEI